MGITREQAFPSRYLKQEHVSPPITVTMDKVWMETLSGEHGDEDKAILGFTDSSIKPMVLNATNWDMIVSAYSSNTDTWAGKPVEIYVDPGVRDRTGKRTGGIRIRIPNGTPIGSGTVASSILTFAQAVALAGTAGMSKEDFVVALKNRGLVGYNAARDTATAQAIIAAFSELPKQDESFDAAPAEDLPF